MKKVNRVLISVFDKNGLVNFARTLINFGCTIISTGGTAKLLTENGINCISVTEITDAPEMLDGRVKTLHPKIHAAILAKRKNADHMQQLAKHGIEPIDMVVINLYPFSDVIAKPDTTLDLALENIDIGGPTMIRAAAKNFTDVAVITSPQQYQAVAKELTENSCSLSLDTKKKLAVEAFQKTHHYDGIITHYLQGEENERQYPANLTLNFEKVQDLRYGENPHQSAAFYKNAGNLNQGITGLQQLHGKELSFNNIMDLDAVVKMVSSFDDPCSVIVKHSNPCGVAVAATVYEAFIKAYATDSVSAFGGIFGFNRTVDLTTAEELKQIFIEVVVAPDFEKEALELLQKKKNLRLLKIKPEREIIVEKNLRKVAGGLLIQDEDIVDLDEQNLKIVSKRKPTTDEMAALKFAWKVVKWVKSNAVIFCHKDRTIGIGAGQMSRVDSSRFAVEKATAAGLSLAGTVVASDAFFPFRDGVDAAAQAGATAIIQPGGSVRDEEVIQAADEQNMTMIFTGIRHFRH